MQGAVGFFDIHLTANLPRNLPVKVFVNWLRIDRIMVTAPFFGPPCSLFFATDQSHRIPCFAEIQPISQPAAAATHLYRGLVLDTHTVACH